MDSQGLKLTKVGLPLLKTKDLKEFINLSEDIEVENTRNVGKINANNVARIATKEEGNIKDDNSTVVNALNLNGVSANMYLSKDEAIDLRSFAKDVSVTQSEEIRKLRDELYQTREQLVRHGVLRDYTLYNGCYDIFNLSKIKYEDNTYLLEEDIKQDSDIIKLEDVNDFFIGEYIALIKTNKSEDEEYTANQITVSVLEIKDIDLEKREIKIDRKLSTSSKEEVLIRKTAGEYDEGSFIFAKVKNDVPTGIEMHSTFLDDKYVENIPINKSYTGFGVSFRVDNKIAGALKKFKVAAKPNNGRDKMGCQGLDCFVIKDTAENRKIFSSIENVERYEKETGKKIILARANKAKTKYSNEFLTFDFEKNGAYPKIYNSGKENHLFIFSDANADKDINWSIEFATTNVAKELEDLHKHNISYFYDGNVRGKNSSLTTPDYLKNRELRFSLTTEKIKDKSYIPFKEGLYTRVIDLPKDTPSTNIRVSLRTARESNLKIDNNSFILGKNEGTEIDNSTSSITVKPDIGLFTNTSLNSGYYGIEKDDNIIIGENLFKVDAVNGNEIYIKNLDNKYKEIKKGSMVHRCGYEISLRGYNYDIVKDDDNNLVKRINEEDQIVLPIKFKGSVIDEDNYDSNSTNRLIFENEFTDKERKLLKNYSHFELQIKWNSNFDFNKEKSKIESKSDEEAFESLIGRIKECVISFSKSNHSGLFED